MNKLGHDVLFAVFGTPNTLNKFAHGVVLLFFGTGCWFISVLLRLPTMVRLRGVSLELPAFTRFCMNVGPPLLIGLTAIASAYCLWIWFSRGEPRRSWTSFLAVVTAALFLITLPIIIALYLPLVNLANHLNGTAP